jgi:hypothetical protein
MGERGSLLLSLDTVLAMVLVLGFAMLTFTYVQDNANGDAFFSRFYAADLSTSADLVNAGAGDVILRYDNIKKDSKLSFWLTSTSIRVGTTPVQQLQIPPDTAAVGYYGNPGGNPKNFEGDTFILNPQYLVLRKIGSSFAVNEAEKALTTCTAVTQRQVEFKDARVFLQAPEEISKSFKDSIKESGITVAESQTDATIVITIEKKIGAKNELAFAPASEEARSLYCNFEQQLAALTITQFDANEPGQTQGTFQAAITITAVDSQKPTDEQIGRALAHALAVHFR